MKWYKRLERKIKTFRKNIQKNILEFFFVCRIGKDIVSGNKNRKFAFFTPLPPEKTGTALYALKVYQYIFDELDFIYDVYDIKKYCHALSFISEKYHKNILPLCMVQERKYKHFFLNLGNNCFHVPCLQYGIQTKGKDNRHIVLCETQLCGLLCSYYESRGVDFTRMLIKYYPEKNLCQEELDSDFYGTLRNKNIFGIRILIAITGISHFVLYRNIGRDLLFEDIKGSEYENSVEISVIPMGIEKISMVPEPAALEEQGYNIGSFGIASDIKQTDKVIKAVDLLNRQGEKITLWLAGYEVRKYADRFKSSNLRIVENPGYDSLLSLMNSVDMAVQLRKFSNGEGSGCIAELIALNKNFIATDNLFEPYYASAGVSVSADCTVEELAGTIIKELKKKTVRDNSAILKKYSFENTAQAFKHTVA